MAAKRTAQKAVDWAAFVERVPPGQKSQFNALKGKSDAIRAKYISTPQQPPAIDWAYYKQRIGIPGLVDKFQKEFQSVKVPYPQDTYSSKIEEQVKTMDGQAAQFKVASDKRIAQYEKEVSKLNSMIPYEEMTMEEYVDYFPEAADNLKKYPWWPHTPVWDQKA